MGRLIGRRMALLVWHIDYLLSILYIERGLSLRWKKNMSFCKIEENVRLAKVPR